MYYCLTARRFGTRFLDLEPFCVEFTAEISDFYLHCILIWETVQWQETCEPCDSSCRHCTGPRADQCLTCHPDSALHAVENRCARCCQARGNDTGCCVCDTRSGRDYLIIRKHWTLWMSQSTEIFFSPPFTSSVC